MNSRLTYRSLLLLLLLLLLPLPVAAQEQEASDLQMDVLQAGYDGQYRVNEWFPVTVEVSNDGPDRRVVLDWRYAAGTGGPVFQREIDLPRDSRKRVTLNVLSKDFARVADLRLRVENDIIHEQEVRLTPLENEQSMIAVLSSDETLLNSLSTIETATMRNPQVVRMEADYLPDNASALSGLDVIFVHDIPTADLSTAQREALTLWTSLGGTLVVSGGINAEDTVPGLGDLLPVDVQDLQNGISLEPLNDFVKQDPLETDTTTTTSNVELRPGAEALDNEQLITVQRIGNGRVIFAAFDFAVLRSWRGEPDFWETILPFQPHVALAGAFRWRNSDLLRGVLHFPELDLPSFEVMLLFVAGYIVLIGPVNFLVLRRLKRADLAWFTIPVLVVVFVVATYSASFLIRGIRPQLIQVGVIQGFEGQQNGLATSFLGVFSPNRGTFTLEFPNETLVSTGGEDNMFGVIESADSPVRWTDTNTQVRDILVDVSSLRTFIAEQNVSVPVQVSSSLERQPNTLTGEVRNTGSAPLQDALLVSGDSVQHLGTIAPDATAEVDLTLNQGTFPRRANVATEGMFNRQLLLNILSDTSQPTSSFAQPPPAVPGNQIPESLFSQNRSYLLAWGETPTLEAELAGTVTEQSGLTLYMIRLQETE